MRPALVFPTSPGQREAASNVLLVCFLTAAAGFLAASFWPLTEAFPRLPTAHEYGENVGVGLSHLRTTPQDWLERLAVCVPVGLFLALYLRSRGVARATLLASGMVACFFVAVEFLQPLFWRHWRVSDLIVAITLGWFGVALSGLNWRRASFAWLGALAIGLNLIAAGAIWITHQGLSFAQWNCSFPLVIGDESSGGRAWRGEVLDLAIFDQAASPALLRGLEPIAQVRGPIGGASASSPEMGADVCEALKRSGEFTLLVTLRTSEPKQRGPARIVTQSEGFYTRNFTLGQQDEEFALRLRTDRNGPNGDRMETRRKANFADGQAHDVVVTHRGGTSRLWLDGALLGQADHLHAKLIVGEFFALPVALVLGGLLFVSGLIFGLRPSKPGPYAALWALTASAPLLLGLDLQIAAGYELLPALLAVTALAPLLGAFTTSAIRHRASRRSVWNADVPRS
jgi:hypothetical protein